MDRNNDGKLSENELPQSLRRMFDRMDAIGKAVLGMTIQSALIWGLAAGFPAWFWPLWRSGAGRWWKVTRESVFS